MLNRSKSIKVGVLGAGAIVRDVHLPVLSALPDVQVVWVADTQEERAHEVARAYGVHSWLAPATPKDLPEADVVLVAIPWGARSPYLDELADRQVAAYVEKPLARTVLDHEALCAAFGAARLADGLQRRSYGPVVAARLQVDQALFGQLRAVRYEVGGPGIVVGSRYGADFALAGGGILFETSVHGLDAVLRIVSAKSVHLVECNMILDGMFDIDTQARAILTRDDGSQVEFHLVASYLRPTSNALELQFEHATVSFSLFSWSGFHVKGCLGGYWRLDTNKPLLPLTAFQTFARHWSRFLEGVRKGVPNETSAIESVTTTHLIEQLYEGRLVKREEAKT